MGHESHPALTLQPARMSRMLGHRGRVLLFPFTITYVCASASFFSCAAFHTFQLESPRHEGLPSKKNTHLPVAVSLRAKERRKKPRNREQRGGGLEVEAGASGAVGRARGGRYQPIGCLVGMTMMNE